MLPPLANLLAAREDDPAALGALAADLATSGEFTAVWRPAPGWVAASAPLPGGEPDGPAVRAHGLAFGEGRDGIAGSLERAAALAERAPAALASLPGDVGFIHFAADGGATVARSCGGLVPFYLHSSGTRLTIATRLGDLARWLPDNPRLDPLGNAVWTTGFGFFPDGRTFLAGARMLERGSFARVAPDGRLTLGRYWDPRPAQLPRPTPERRREHAERLRALLVAHLTRDLDPTGGNLLTLSGGVDSSALGALAAGTVRRPVWTWSLLPEPEDLFRREMGYIEPLARRFGFGRRWVVRLRATTRLELLGAAPRVVFHVIHPALCDLPRVLREAPVRVLFGGEFADEVCGSVFTLPDWAAHTSPVALLAGLGRLPTGPRDLARWAKRRVLAARPLLPYPPDLPDFVRREVREEYHGWLERRRRDVAADDRPLRQLALRSELDGFVAMNWEVSSALGVRRSFPFFSREVLELAFECHPAELVGPGTKKLLRAALRDDVPAINLGRQDKGRFSPNREAPNPTWEVPLPETLAPVLDPGWLRRPPGQVTRGEAERLMGLVRMAETIGARHPASPPARWDVMTRS